MISILMQGWLLKYYTYSISFYELSNTVHYDAQENMPHEKLITENVYSICGEIPVLSGK